MKTNLNNVAKFGLLLLGSFALIACSTPPAPKTISIAHGKKIGVIVDASAFPTHTHLSTSFLSQPFVKKLKTSWQIEESIISTLRYEIENSTDFQVVNLKSIGINSSTHAKIIKPKIGTWQQNNEIANKLRAEGINLVINITETPTQASEYCSIDRDHLCQALYSQGYGVVSRGYALGNNFYASASFNTQIESVSPPALLNSQKEFRGFNAYHNTNRELRYNEVPRSEVRITEEELKPFKREVIQHFTDLGKKIVLYLDKRAS